MKKQKFAVIELFAGVGGFRLGLEGDKRNGSFYSAISEYKEKIENPEYFVTGYANQFEPGRKKQFAATVYNDYYGDGVLQNKDIAQVNYLDIQDSFQSRKINPEKLILVGGFPCQDYSVANGLHTSKGLIGKKGVLWWEIYRLIKELRAQNQQPEVLLLENVDRLLVSPAKQRGRDFAIMLYTLNYLGYTVEYKVINAAEYDFPQKRKRVFIFAYLKKSPLNHRKQYHKNIREEFRADSSELQEKLDLALYKNGGLLNSLNQLENEFHFKKSPFGNAGICRNFKVYPFKEKGIISHNCKTLGDILIKDKGEVASEFIVDKSSLVKWKEYKGAKKILRLKPNGEPYYFAEGKMNLFDSLNAPSRTIITSEGGNSASRTKHLIKLSRGQRRLHPIELERLNMFPDNITLHEGISNTERAFMMGNALVVGIVEKFRNLIIAYYD
jgi:DNA (cytosine-5)-methyltransferase 1